MEMLVPIIVGLLLLAGLGALFAARDVWRAYHLTIAAFLILTATVFLYLAARTLQTHIAYRTNVVAHEKALKTATDEKTRLVDGTGSPDPADLSTYGIDQLNSELKRALAGRGRVWDRGVANGFDPGTGTVSLTFDPVAPRIQPETIVFAFDTIDRTQGGQYMGEFLVSAVTDRDIQLTSVYPLLPWQTERIPKAAGQWILYEVMPADTHDAFATLNEEQLRAMLPAETLAEYLKDGKPAEPNDPAERVWRQVKFLKDATVKVDDVEVAFTEGQTATLDPKTAQELVSAGEVEETGQVYVRELRSYAQLFRELRQQIQILSDTQREMTDEIARIQQSWDAVKQDIEYRTKEIAALKVDKEKFAAELAAVEQLVQAIDKQQVAVRADLSKTYRGNLAKVAEIADLQQQALQAAEAQASVD